MQFSSSLLTLLSLASVAVSSAVSVPHTSSCKASDRVPVSTRNVTSLDGHEIQISTQACSADVLNAPRSLAKRQVYEPCSFGIQEECIINQGTGPAEADCTVIVNYFQSEYEANSQAIFGPVSPGYAEVWTYNTCEIAWINNEPVSGGYSMEYCYINMYSNSFNMAESCIVPGYTGAYLWSVPSSNQVDLNFAIEILAT